MSEPKPDSKIVFRVDDGEGGVNVETLWATRVAENTYRLDNSPFYAYSVSWEDVVLAPIDPDDGRPTFESVVEKSGRKTVRVIFDPPVEEGNESDRQLAGLLSLGCTYEGANSSYISVDIPPEVELEKVRDFLVDCGAQWEHADPSYSELYPDDD